MSADAAGTRFRLTPRQKLLFPLIMCGAFFEGFDFMVVNLALPFISRDMGTDTKTTAFTLSIIAVGTLLAFFVVRLGDRVGRKPVFLWSVVLYSVLSLLTAFTPNIQYFVACQLLARVFLVACWATGFIVIAEEFSVDLRGRALGMFQAAAAIGAVFPSLCMPLLAGLGYGWRGLYVLGAVPLLVVIFLGRNFHETERFQKARQAEGGGPGLFAIFRPPYRKYIIVVSLLWVFIYLCYTTTQNFFSYRVVNELGWNESRVGFTTAVAYLFGLTGYYAAGKLLDAIGRKPTAVIFFLCGSVLSISTFQATSYPVIVGLLIAATFFVGVFTVIGASFTNELFPTAIRANATAWGNNIVGRLGQIAAPAIVGSIAAPVGGIGNAVSILALAPLVGAALVILLLPETRNRELQDYVIPPS